MSLRSASAPAAVTAASVSSDRAAPATAQPCATSVSMVARPRVRAPQVGEDGADEAKSGVLSRRVVGNSGLEGFPAEQRVDLALGVHGRPGQGEIGVR